jgi:hypothetical protein
LTGKFLNLTSYIINWTKGLSETETSTVNKKPNYEKIPLSFVLASAFFNQSKACAWYDPDYDYFNLFTQNIIRDKSFTPFLLTYSSRFYEDEKAVIPNENIEKLAKIFRESVELP